MLSRFVFVLLTVVVQAAAQFSGAIQGTVVDATEAAVPSAIITVRNTETGVTRQATTSVEGFYRISNLGPGTYTLAVEKTGFVTAQREDLQLGFADIARADFRLVVGGLAEKINVQAAAIQVETEQGRVSGRIDRVELKELPLNGRNVFNLLALQPGMSGLGLSVGFGGGGAGSQGQLPITDSFAGESGPQVYASGQRWDMNNYSVDESSTNGNARNGVTNLTPNAESVEEVRVVSNNFSAVDGRNPAAQIQVITKGGTNEFHGTASYYNQNNVMAAHNEFEAKVPAIRKNQYGYSFGGPIIKNRTFFFTTFEGLRQSGNRAGAYTVETKQLVDYVLQTRPNSIAAKLLTQYAPVVYPTTGLKDLGSPAAGPFTIGPPDGIPDVGTVNVVPGSFRNAGQYSIRIDHELRPGKDKLYGSFFRTANENQVGTGSGSTAGGVRAAFNRPTDELTYFGNLNFTHIFSPTMLNEFRSGFMQLLGYPIVPAHLDVPNISINGGIPGFGGGNYPLGWWQSNYDVKDTFSWIHHTQTIKAGFEYRRPVAGNENTNNYIPTYTFNSLLNFVNDEPYQEVRQVDPATGTPVLTLGHFWSNEWSLFINDDWKVTRNLTLNIGLRWENYGTFLDKAPLREFVFGAGNSYSERLANGKLDFVSRLVPPGNLNFGPRFGFAWDPTGRGKMSIRGGYGIGYDRLTSGSNQYQGRVTVNLGPQFGTSFLYSLGDPSKPLLGYPVDPALQKGLDPRGGVIGARITAGGIDPGFRSPYVENLFLGVQREISRGTLLEVNYIGSLGHRLLNGVNVNRYAGDFLSNGTFHGFNSSFSTITMRGSNSNSSYHGAVASIKHAFSSGFTLQGSYTFGKAIDDTDTGGAGGWQNAYNRSAEKGLAGFDTTRKVSLVGLWDMPFFKGKGWTNRVLGGWQLSGFTILQSGQPYTVTTTASWPSGDYNGDGSGGDRPNAPTTPLPSSGYSRSQFLQGIFSASAFSKPAPGTDGTLGRDTYRGPGFAETDLSLAKKFAFTERFSAKLQVDSFNAFNRVNLTSLDLNLASGTFGRATGAFTPRLFQLGLKLQF